MINQELVSVVVLNYNGAHLLDDCLQSLLVQDYPNFEIVVVDNASADQSASVVAKYPRVRWLGLPENHGLGPGYNAGAKNSRGGKFFFTNNDVRFEKSCISKLAEAFDSNDIFSTDPMQKDWSGRTVTHGAQKVKYEWNFSFGVPCIFPYQETAVLVRQEVAWACAGAMMVDRLKFEAIGGFDPTFFLDYEDLDICIRAWLRGWRNVFVPEAVLYHKVGETEDSKLRSNNPDIKNRSAAPRINARRELSASRNPGRIILKTMPVHWVLTAYAVGFVFFMKLLFTGRFKSAALRVQALLLNLFDLPVILKERNLILQGKKKTGRDFVKAFGQPSDPRSECRLWRHIKKFLRYAQHLIGEFTVWILSLKDRRNSSSLPDFNRIFILRNNDLGDLLIVTPLFEALRRRFPKAFLCAGIGKWGEEILRGNPYLDEVIYLRAPWFNKFVRPQTFLCKVFYLLFSEDVKIVRRKKFDLGIDVLGSLWGTFLLISANIPYRLGVKKYAGGYSGVQQCVTFDPFQQVGEAALGFTKLLGLDARDMPVSRPQIFLSAHERKEGVCYWDRLETQKGAGRSTRIVLGPGGGVPVKCWPFDKYMELVKKLSHLSGIRLMVVGDSNETKMGDHLALIDPSLQNMAGILSLRQTFSLVAAADFVICNSSMLMHAAAAFEKPTLVMLGKEFESSQQHSAQWGYSGISHHLGKEGGVRAEIFSADEALQYLLSYWPHYFNPEASSRKINRA